MNFLVKALDNLRPNSVWHISVIDGVEQIFWRNETNVPTEEEIQAKIAELQAAEPMRLLRIERDNLLAATDWTQSRDVQLKNDTAWREYRQALRDMPATQVPLLDENGVLYNVTWPEKPE